jgi:DNA-binding Xre family transcriptional regulator
MTNLIINNINKYIEENHIKQTWIAEQLDTHKMNMSNILSGKKKNVSFEELNSIIELLDLNLDDVSRDTFLPKNLIEVSLDTNIPDYIACCGNISNPTTRQTITLVGELIDIIDEFKRANLSSVTR